MNYIATNVVAILIATLAGLAVGALYYALRTGRDTTPEHRGSGHRVRLFVVASVAEFWLASILAGALILAPTQANAWTMAIGSAVVIWIGFVVPVLATSDSFHRMPVSVLILDCAHWLVVMVSQAAVLQAWGLTHP